MVLLVIIVSFGATILAMTFMKRSLSFLATFAAGFIGAALSGAICREFAAPAQAMLFHPISALFGACAFIWLTNRYTKPRS